MIKNQINFQTLHIQNFDTLAKHQGMWEINEMIILIFQQIFYIETMKTPVLKVKIINNQLRIPLVLN